jgi:hypothetical protein
MRKQFFTFFLVVLFYSSHAIGQKRFGYGFTLSNDLYNRFVNPKDNIASGANGSAILNFGGGPKLWYGGNSTTFSIETQAAIGFLGTSLKDPKGLGNAHFPLMAKLNFKGLSAMDKEGQLGFSIGGGVQYNKTEIFGLDDDFEKKGGTRNLYRTYIVQAGYGFGIAGFGVQGFARYGWNKDKASALNIGLQWDFNLKQLKKISTKESSL